MRGLILQSNEEIFYPDALCVLSGAELYGASSREDEPPRAD